jgi:hypothetical protein
VYFCRKFMQSYTSKLPKMAKLVFSVTFGRLLLLHDGHNNYIIFGNQSRLPSCSGSHGRLGLNIGRNLSRTETCRAWSPLKRVDHVPWKRMDHLPRSAWINSREARGLPPWSVRIASLGSAWMTSPEACGTPSSSAWITSLGSRGSTPSERWITSLGAHWHQDATRL